MYGCQPPSSDGSHGESEATADYTKRIRKEKSTMQGLKERQDAPQVLHNSEELLNSTSVNSMPPKGLFVSP
jgi:hypothetical protein